jgi:hypothetical protein
LPDTAVLDKGNISSRVMMPSVATHQPELTLIRRKGRVLIPWRRSREDLIRQAELAEEPLNPVFQYLSVLTNNALQGIRNKNWSGRPDSDYVG